MGAGLTGSFVCLDMLANQVDLPRDAVETWTPYAGGAPCNVSAALGNMGVPVVIATAVGKDEMGNNLLDILEGKSDVHPWNQTRSRLLEVFCRSLSFMTPLPPDCVKGSVILDAI